MSFVLQLVEGYHITSLQLNPNDNDVGYGRQPAETQSDGFFHPLCEPTLQIGYAFDPELILRKQLDFKIHYRRLYPIKCLFRTPSLHKVVQAGHIKSILQIV